MNNDHIEIHFSVDGISYEAQAWPDQDIDNNSFCQVTFFDTTLPGEAKIIYLDNPTPGQWKQRVEEDGEKMMPDDFITALGKQLDVSM